MSNKIIEIICPECELKRKQKNIAKWNKKYYFCNQCGSQYHSEESANKVREELKSILKR